MKKNLLFLSALIVAQTSQSQLATFENPVLASESAWYGQDQVTDGDTIYTSDFFSFETNYNAGWGSYAGWAVSNVTDNTTPGWSNQYSAITGSGEAGSDQYGVCYVSSWEGSRVFLDFTFPSPIVGFSVTNTTYAYFAMLNGDDFTKPFGADTNAQGIIDGTNGEDWFLLTIYGLNEDSLQTGDSVNFYLADFRFPLDADDYIIDEWTFVDLTSLGAVKGLEFVLTSTDTTGGFGMNNPAYFAAENFEVSLGVEENEISELEVYPNPTTGLVKIQTQFNEQISIYDAAGKLIFSEIVSTSSFEIDLSDFENGLYFITAVSADAFRSAKVIKN
ncbi:MAG: DUF4465 domain-containing protein [Crocinitomicaceae bacterium]|jgi:hypothetical protein|nr:DUF4465 domain-containing protein [Crocinitomicaceae bacterium]